MIRDEALRLFAARGVAAVTVRQIASAASVSPALVVHHFGSKEGLREVVDEHVVTTFEAMLGEMTSGAVPDLYDPAATGSLAELMVATLPAGSPVPAYLRQMLLTDSEAGRSLFRRLFATSQGMVAALSNAGWASPGADPAVRAAFLLVNDLAVLLLRDQIADVLGVDPLAGDGLAAWTREVLTVYGGGLRADASGPDNAQGDAT